MKMHGMGFALIVNLIQMRRIQVIGSRKSASNKEPRHFVEFKPIEGGNAKMREIRFVPNVNLIQMRQTRVSSGRENGGGRTGIEESNQTRAGAQ
jgi:hypothetical protein